MSLHSLLNQPLSIQTMQASTTADAYGNKGVATFGTPTNAVGFIEQVTSTEDLLNRDTTKTYWKCFLPAGTVVGHLDRIIFGSQTFEVDGEPWIVWNPGKREVSHVVCNLVTING